MQITSIPQLRRSAFSLPEILMVVAVVGILSGVGYIGFSNFKDSVKEQVLKSDVSMLNSAISTYLGFGGSLDKASTAEDVISKLRSVANTTMAKRIPGLTGSMVDRRTTLNYQSSAETASDAPRVYWNEAEKRFDFARSGKVGGIALVFVDHDA